MLFLKIFNSHYHDSRKQVEVDKILVEPCIGNPRSRGNRTWCQLRSIVEKKKSVTRHPVTLFFEHRATKVFIFNTESQSHVLTQSHGVTEVIFFSVSSDNLILFSVPLCLCVQFQKNYIAKQLKPPSTTATVPVTNLAASDIR